MVIVTMTTLGYGDVVPVTLVGRLIAGLMSVLGIFLMALLISVIHETLQLSQSEKRILAHLENAGRVNANAQSNKHIGAVSISRHFLIPCTGGAFSPLGPFLCPTTEKKLCKCISTYIK
jgi:hypothetical protein